MSEKTDEVQDEQPEEVKKHGIPIIFWIILVVLLVWAVVFYLFVERTKQEQSDVPVVDEHQSQEQQKGSESQAQPQAPTHSLPPPPAEIMQQLDSLFAPKAPSQP